MFQTRSRAMAVHAQFGGNRCDGDRSETRACETTQGCPLEEGCGDRFRCRSGQCIDRALLCNGDQDCEEDGQDEQDCAVEKYITCGMSVPPPNIKDLGFGFDVVSGKQRGSVINTVSFGGQCRKIYSGVHNTLYRLPLSIIQYSFLVKAQNDFSDETFTSEWHYAKDVINREKVTGTTTGFSNYDFHQTHDTTQSGQTQIPLSKSGTSRMSTLKKVDVEGGGTQQIAALMLIQPSSPDRNWEMYSNWAESVGSFPNFMKQTLRPLSELVKEVQCAGAKRLYLRRAIEQYLSESHTCHCRPCRNNGMVVMVGDECTCICKPGTLGVACEKGTEAEGQPGVIDGIWACWSAWSSCSGVKRSRSRSCSNPAPQNAGQQCIGEPTETSDCEDQDMQYLKTMEPQCFDQTLPASQICGTPPALINGYILVPKDIYLVGSKVDYTCTEGLYLVGFGTIECTASQTWSAKPGLCTNARCTIDSLDEDVIASPKREVYGIGESVTLSCPEGRQLIGEATLMCDPSLNFSPDPADIKCSPVTGSQTCTSSLQCQPWEKSSRGKCVCKMPFECSSSLEVCVTTSRSRSPVLLNVCKMQSLQCLGKNHTMAEESSCVWPQRITTDCTNCHIWETCDDQTNACRCKESADCLTPGSNVCVQVGEDASAASQTMSECEAGQRRCKGEKVTVVSILPCAA
ncbi:Complement component C7 [Dissostichus eleginoides]|uniref:Complement component C7 n=1 Tax=Dissostichus eleginoides TaxID=100907 RepID=A0AAD9BZF2_DISEL|nr:Complement component C7 [Dissostichus eleginoides]